MKYRTRSEWSDPWAISCQPHL